MIINHHRKIMQNQTKKLLIQKSLIPMDWDPKKKGGYDEWRTHIRFELFQTMLRNGAVFGAIHIAITHHNELVDFIETRIKMESTLLQAQEILSKERRTK